MPSTKSTKPKVYSPLQLKAIKDVYGPYIQKAIDEVIEEKGPNGYTLEAVHTKYKELVAQDISAALFREHLDINGWEFARVSTIRRKVGDTETAST